MMLKEEMSLTDTKQGTRCVPSITMALFEAEEELCYTLSIPAIIYFTQGTGIATFDDGSTVELDNEHLYLIASGRVSMCIRQAMQAIVCHVPKLPNELLCEDSEHARFLDTEFGSRSYAIIRSNSFLENFYDGMLFYLTCEMSDEGLFKAKAMELHKIIAHSTARREYVRFFAPLLHGDYLFDMFVHRYAKKVSKVAQLAELANVSPRVLNSRFRVNFGVSPKKILRQERMKWIKQELLNGSRPLKEIAYEHGISVQYLTYLCKKELDMTPTQIRGKKIGLE